MSLEQLSQKISLDALGNLNVTFTDVAEIIILSFIIYQIMMWIKSTRAWTLLKGFAVILAVLALAAVFKMNTILWIAKNFFSLGITALIIVFQPELRKALEQLGEKNILSSIVPFDNSKKEEKGITDRTISELVKACFEMGKARTGALIVLEQTVTLQDYERTGIMVDSAISSQLILNIFEKNTPLHDGAMIISENRIRSATCYLPLSDNMNLSKALGTRHRAAVGISEVSDSLTIVVSEETGSVSVAKNGRLLRNLNQEQLCEQLQNLQVKPEENRKIKLWKGRSRHETKTDK
ncbi:MAG: diadenylate cyclase CdaA [Lachnospiraceae bacterium]|nr:diadenylate cyclase CdaA [Lachnospiraceae bacterium]